MSIVAHSVLGACLCVYTCVLVTTKSCAKTAEPIEMPSGTDSCELRIKLGKYKRMHGPPDEYATRTLYGLVNECQWLIHSHYCQQQQQQEQRKMKACSKVSYKIRMQTVTWQKPIYCYRWTRARRCITRPYTKADAFSV